MRWRFADKIHDFEPWLSIQGSKAVSFEEYSLLKPFGRKGAYPEMFVIESCVHVARWLVVRSSEFRSSCILQAVEEFQFLDWAGMGDRLRINLLAKGRDEMTVQFRCDVHCGERRIAQGRFAVALLPLREIQDAEAAQLMWRELYATA